MSDDSVLEYRVTEVRPNVACPDSDATTNNPEDFGITPPPALQIHDDCSEGGVWTAPTEYERITLQTSQGYNRNWGELVIVIAEPARARSAPRPSVATTSSAYEEGRQTASPPNAQRDREHELEHAGGLTLRPPFELATSSSDAFVVDVDDSGPPSSTTGRLRRAGSAMSAEKLVDPVWPIDGSAAPARSQCRSSRVTWIIALATP